MRDCSAIRGCATAKFPILPVPVTAAVTGISATRQIVVFNDYVKNRCLKEKLKKCNKCTWAVTFGNERDLNILKFAFILPFITLFEVCLGTWIEKGQDLYPEWWLRTEGNPNKTNWPFRGKKIPKGEVFQMLESISSTFSVQNFHIKVLFYSYILAL